MLYQGHYVHNKKGKNTNKAEWLNVLAQKIAEVRLSELGYHFIPGIAPYFRRLRKSIEAKALIVKSVRSIINNENTQRTT